MIEPQGLFSSTISGAAWSTDMKYRFDLWRQWDSHKIRMAFVMLNPSTADDVKNDPTVARCQRRALRLGAGSFHVVNLFALRSTDPSVLYKAEDPIGSHNDQYILKVAELADLIVCSWGTRGNLKGRADQVRAILEPHRRKLRHLGLTANGEPTHPLYIPYDAELQVYQLRREDDAVEGIQESG